MQTVTINVPDELWEHYRNIDDLKQEIFEDFVASEYKKGNITLRQGARMLEVTYEQFMVNVLGDRKISFINTPLEELEAESRIEDAWIDEVLGARM